MFCISNRLIHKNLHNQIGTDQEKMIYKSSQKFIFLM